MKRELSGWDRFLAAIAHPVRLLCWGIALGTFFGPIGGLSWIVVAVFAVAVALLVGELAARSRVRLAWLIGAPLGLLLATALVQGAAVRWQLLPGIVGAAEALWLAMLLAVAAVSFFGVGLLRILGRRGPAYEAVELFALGGLLAHAVSSHRDGSIARPLWLSDLCWSFGVDPGRVLLFFGAMLTGLLASLLLLGANRRKPGVGLLALPLVAVLAWMLATQLPTLQPPDPEQLFAEAGGEEGQGGEGDEGGQGGGDESGGQGGDQDGSGKPNNGEGGKSQEGGSQDGQQGQGQSQGGEAGEGGGAGGDGQTEGGQAGGQGEKEGAGGAGAEEGEGGASDSAPNPLEGGSSSGQQPVAVVLIDDDYSPPGGMWYLRQGELSDFNGSRLIQSTVDGTQDDLADHFAVAEEPLTSQAPEELRKDVHGSVSLLVEHPSPFGPEAVVSYGPRANPSPRFDRSYTFTSRMLNVPLQELVGRGVGDPEWSEELRAQYLELPTDPRYAELAAQIRDEAAADIPDEELREDPLVQAANITIWLGENMKYSKAERHADVPDPTADFLFGNRIGYCVHSAHASVYLWRTLGIPSRIATGYAVEEAERRGSVLVVQSGAAHAWSEVYVTGAGWVPLDVAPSENLDESGEGADEDENQMLGEMARQQPADPPGPRPDYSWIWRWLSWFAGSTLGSLVAFLLILHWSIKLWRRARPLWAGATALPRVAYRSGLDQLAEAGLVREEGETREAFARRLEMPSLTELTALHLRGQLGTPTRQSRATWTGLLARLRVDLRKARPFWRRWLGWFDPSSFYRAR